MGYKLMYKILKVYLDYGAGKKKPLKRRNFKKNTLATMDHK
jgi:hypothetical protein